MITYTNKLDMYPGAVPLVIHLGQYDSDFSLVFNLFSSAGTFTVESSTTAEIRGTKEDGNGYSATATIDISNKRVTVAGNVQMTAISGENVFELVLKKSGKVLSTANFILDVEHAAMDAGTVPSESVIQEIGEVTSAYLDEHPELVYQVDDTLSVTGAAADAGVTGREINAIKDDLSDIQDEIDTMSGGLTTDIKNALLALFQNVAYVGTDGQDYYDNLVEAFDNSEGVESITATFSPGGETFYDTDSIDILRDYLTVTATLISGRTKTVTDYRLVGTMAVGTNTITVKYGGKTATFNVAVVWGYKLRETFASDGTNKIDTSKRYPVGHSTVAIEFTITSRTEDIKAIISNGLSGSYTALQISTVALWGYGITWNSGKSLGTANHVYRAVVDVNLTDLLHVSMAMQLKDVTSGSAVQQYSNSYTHESDPVYNITLGAVTSGVGFMGTITKCIIESGSWSSDKISAFLAG